MTMLKASVSADINMLTSRLKTIRSSWWDVRAMRHSLSLTLPTMRRGLTDLEKQVTPLTQPMRVSSLPLSSSLTYINMIIK